MMKETSRILVVQLAALGAAFVRRVRGDLRLAGRECRPIQPVFPAVTCTAQAKMRTGQPPSKHGMVGNGFY
jgi:predicted AlkP superfamily pyrophosphatase or phosphodiesterase